MPRKKKVDPNVKKTAEQIKREEDEKEYKKAKDGRRKVATRHVLVVEADMPEDVKRRLFAAANQLRIASNKLTEIMEKRVKALIYQDRYKTLKKQYGDLAQKIGKEQDKKQLSNLDNQKAEVSKQMEAMQKECNVTWDYARKQMEEIAKEMDLNSIFALTIAEDVWRGVETILYRDGERLSYKKKGDLPCIRAKQIERGIPLTCKEGKLWCSIALAAGPKDVEAEFQKQLAVKKAQLGLSEDEKVPQVVSDTLKHEIRTTLKKRYSFSVIIKPKDRFVKDEVASIIAYLQHPEEIENSAIKHWKESGDPQDIYRPCYVSLSCEIIRGKLRVFCHITVEGKPCEKYDSKGNPRHSYGKGEVGIDLGPQCVELATLDKVDAFNLAERNGHSSFENEYKEKELYRAMDRSRRATNPKNYNEDGTIRKGKKIWKKSKRYKKLQKRHRDLCRKNAINRHLAINQKAYEIRAIADSVGIEPCNAKAMQKRAKKQEQPTLDAVTQNATAAETTDVRPADYGQIGKPSQEEVKRKVEAKGAKDGKEDKTTNNVKGSKQLNETTTEDKPKRGRGQGRRKRFGHSILNRCPGYFFARLKQVFESTGGKFHVVDKMYRASQYDHQANTYIKKKLGDRKHIFPDGLAVQRDIYSSYLLLCHNEDYTAPDRDKCIRNFEKFRKNHDECMKRLARNHVRVCNF